MYYKNLKEELKSFDRYIKRYKQMEENERKKAAKESLIRSGVLNKNGNLKEHIVTTYDKPKLRIRK